MERENDSLLNSSSSYGTSGGTVLTTPTFGSDTDLLNTDEDSLTTQPLRSDLEMGMSTDLSSGVVSGPNFSGNLDADTDTGLTTDTPDIYSIPVAINETSKNNTLAQEPKDKIEEAKTALSNATDSAKAQASQLAEQAKSQVSALTAQATDKVKEQLGTQKGKAADSLGTVSQAVRQAADSLSLNGQEQFGTAVNSLATHLDGVTGYLRDKNVDEIAQEVTDYARKNPQIFIGGAFLLGIAFARFLKSSQRMDSTSGALVPANTSRELVPSTPSAW